MDGKATALLRTTTTRRWAIDLVILVAIGLLMGFLGPFSSEHVPVVGRYIYWMICMVGGGLIGIAADEGLRRRIANLWIRTLLVSVLMTPVVTLHVFLTESFMFGGHADWAGFSQRCLQVCPILLAVMAVRALVWRQLPARVETRTLVVPPLPRPRRRSGADYRPNAAAPG